MILYRKILTVIKINCFMWFFFIGNDRIRGVPKAAKNNQNCTSSKLSIAMIIVQLHT